MFICICGYSQGTDPTIKGQTAGIMPRMAALIALLALLLLSQALASEILGGRPAGVRCLSGGRWDKPE